jgi:hypothetical protein
MLKSLVAVSGLALGLAAFPLTTLAQTPTPMAPMPMMDTSMVDCSTAPAHMMSAMMPPPDAMSKMSGMDTDATYAAMMKAMIMHAAMLSKIEMKCGKNPKVMAMANKMEGQLGDNYLTVEALENGF